jgi:two-component system sensor histidine kinase AgrC
MKQQRVLTLKRGQRLIFWAMPILSVIFLISLLLIGDYYVRWNGYALIIFNIVLLFGMNLVVFYSYQLVAKSCENKQREELLYQHYLKLEESYQASRKIVHDLKNHMQVITELYEMGEIQKAKQYNQEVFHILNQSHHLWYTENRMLNIILNEKLCHKNLQNVKLELDIQEHCLDRINEMDITTIFANLLDNAIEAIGSEGQEPRFLKISIKEAKDFLIIHVANSMGNVQKREKKHEGLGLGNVKEAVEKYEGTCTVEKNEKQFEVIIMISSNHFQEVENYEKK